MNTDVENIKSALKKPIVIVGLMGAGKTKIGGLIAKALDLPFVDADQEIEASAGCTVSDIFEKYGEPEFRALERKVLARLISDDLKVIAPGGGAVMNGETAAIIWDKSVSVWLKASLDILVERTSRNTKRPLLRNGNPREILSGLMDVRYPVYGLANIVVETDAVEAEENANKVLKALAEYLQDRNA